MMNCIKKCPGSGGFSFSCNAIKLSHDARFLFKEVDSYKEFGFFDFCMVQLIANGINSMWINDFEKGNSLMDRRLGRIKTEFKDGIAPVIYCNSLQAPGSQDNLFPDFRICHRKRETAGRQRIKKSRKTLDTV